MARNAREWVHDGWPSPKVIAMGGGYFDPFSTTTRNLTPVTTCYTENLCYTDRSIGFRAVRNRHDLTPILSPLL